MAIVLASASPRRQELLRQVGCDFSVVISDIIEDNNQEVSPQQLVMLHAKEKALDVATKVDKQDVVIGADTIVVFNGNVYGKPEDVDDARRMLTSLSGNEHQVITGIAVALDDKIWTDFVITTVTFSDVTSEEIENYLATGEPMDKAGAYGIQGIGALMVAGIHGCYNNVVGLPLNKLSDVLKKAGVTLL